MLKELLEQLKDDKYRAISSNLEFLIDCGCESKDHADIVRNAIEYIGLLESVIEEVLDEVEKDMGEKK